MNNLTADPKFYWDTLEVYNTKNDEQEHLEPFAERKKALLKRMTKALNDINDLMYQCRGTNETEKIEDIENRFSFKYGFEN